MGLTGVLDFDFGAYRLQTDTAIDFERNELRENAPADVGSDFKIAAFNVLNYFLSLDERGADSEAELARQTSKIVVALDELDADVIGLIEIENDGGASTAALVAALNAATGKTYAAVDYGGLVGDDAITNALIYDTATTGFAGNQAVLDDLAFTDPLNSGRQLNRPAIAATFEDLATGGATTVAVNHLKSKGSLSGVEADEDQGDQQGNNNATRTAAAEALATWLETDPTGAGEADSLIIGDLNAYAMEDPIQALIAAGYTDLALTFADSGDALEPYSYRFSGEWGTLDYALADADLFGQITGTTIWHINADEPEFLDYDDNVRDSGEFSFEQKPDNQNDLVELDAPFRASDHDPVLVGLQLTPTGTPVTIAAADGNKPAFDINSKGDIETVSLAQNQPSIFLDDLVEISALAETDNARLWIQGGEIGVNELSVDKGKNLREGIDAGEGVALDFSDMVDVFRAEITLDLGNVSIDDIDIDTEAPNAVTTMTDPGGLITIDGLANGTIDQIELSVLNGSGVTVAGMKLFVDDATVSV